MRILHVPHAYHPVRGGAEWLCKRVSEELVNLGHEVHVLTADVSSPEAYYQLGIDPVGLPDEVVEGVRVHRLPFGGPLYRSGDRLTGFLPEKASRAVIERVLRTAIWRFTDRLAQEMDRLRPDVVMTLPHLFVNVRAVLEIQRAQGFPLVLVPLLHEDDPYWPFEEAKEAFHQADALVAVTEHEVGRLTGAYGVPDDKVFLAGMGVDFPSGRSYADRRPIVLYLGRKTLAKGIDLLVEAMRTVWKDHPGVTLVLAGARGPLSDKVDALLAGLPPEERGRVRDLDNLSEEAKGELLGSAGCLVLPSRVESFGITLLEAWSHGTPVVALDVPAVRSVVDHDRNGLLVPPDRADELAQAVTSLIEDSARSARMGQTGREKVQARYTWNRVAGQFEKAYQVTRQRRSRT